MNNPTQIGTPAFAAQYSRVRRPGLNAATGLLCRNSSAPACKTPPSHRLPALLQALQHYNDCKLLAIADEEGYVSIVDTACQLPTEMADDWGPNKPRAQWAAHRNAVFDLVWCNVSAGALCHWPSLLGGRRQATEQWVQRHACCCILWSTAGNSRLPGKLLPQLVLRPANVAA